MDPGGVENNATRDRKRKSNTKLRLFAEAYFAASFNATDAALALMPTITRRQATKRGMRLLAKAQADGWVEHVLGRAANAMGSAEVIARLSEQARADMADFVTLEPGGGFTVDLRKAIETGRGPLIRKLSHDRETGAPIVELHDAQAALALLAKVHGLFGDAPPQAPVAPQVNVQVILAQLSDGALREVVAALQGGSGRAIETAAIPAHAELSSTYEDSAPSEAPEPVTPGKP